PLPMPGGGQVVPSSQQNDRRWYVNSQGQTMAIVRGPVEFVIGEGASQHRERRERIGHSFAMATKEGTVEQFQRFMKENPPFQAIYYRLYSPVPTCPMNLMLWDHAAFYCNWLSKKDGLPEDQWCYGSNGDGTCAGSMKLMSNAEERKGYR